MEPRYRNVLLHAACVRVLFLGLSALLSLSAFGAEVRIDFHYEHTKARIELHEPGPTVRLAISHTAIVPDGKKAPIGPKTGPVFQIGPGESRSVALVVRNPTAEDWYFFAAPHVADPPEASQGHFFECLCNHHVFHAPPHSTWYRIVRVNLNEHYAAGKVRLLHAIIGISPEEAHTRYKDRLANEKVPESGSPESVSHEK